MGLAPRAAAIRGDQYQHAIGWYWACQMLRDPDIETVSIEDVGGGHFDDVVVRRRHGANIYIQAKSSNYGSVLVDRHWLLRSATAKGRSPLQHFYDTYLELVGAAKLFSLELWTNRGFDQENPLLGELLDQKSDRINHVAMLSAGPNSAIGKERDAWARHLGIATDDLASLLQVLSWKQAGSELDWRERAKPLMELAGLRSDDEAVTIGVTMASRWVTDGAGPQTADDVRAEVAQKNLLALSGTLVLAVNGIDREPSPTVPNVILDFVDLYEGDDSFSRKLLKDFGDWERVVRPEFERAARILGSYKVRHVQVVGALRHPMWFAAGHALPQVKKWVLTLSQVGAQWHTDVVPQDVAPRVLASKSVGQGTDVGFAVALTGDPTADVEQYIRDSRVAVGRLIALGPDTKPSQTAVTSPEWAMGWTRASREIVRAEVKAARANHVHVFMLCPGGVALMLGHQWNVMPTTTVYEYAGGTYSPTLTFPGA